MIAIYHFFFSLGAGENFLTMKRPLIIILFSLLFFFTNAFSQPGFRPGFVIKNNGDTLFGIIYYSGNNKLTKECRFKHFDIGKEFRFTGKQIKGYGFRNGRDYTSASFLDKNGFMEVILSGRVTLCQSKKNKLYLSKDGKTPVKLTRANMSDGNRQYDDYKEYLHYLMDDQPSLLEPVNNAEFNLASIASLVHEYNTASADLVEYSHTPSLNFLKDLSVSRNTSSTRLNIRVDYELTFMHAKPNNLKFFEEGGFIPSWHPFVGIQLEQRINRRVPGLFFDAGLGYYSDEFYKYAEYSDINNGIYRDDIYVGKKAVNLSLGMHYTFSSLVHKPFLRMGMTGDLIPWYSYSRYSEVEQYGVVRSYASNTIDSYTREMGFYAAAGYDFAIGSSRNLCLEVQYKYGNFSLNNVEGVSMYWKNDVIILSHTVGIGLRINL